MKPSDPQAHATVAHMDPEFGHLAIEVANWTWSREGLTPHFCSLLCIAADVCMGTTGLPLQMHVQIAFSNEVTPQQMHETMLTVAPWAGYPQCMVALVRLKDILGQFDMGNLPSAGAESALDASVEAELRTYTPTDRETGDFVLSQIRRIWGRQGLSNAERAMLSAAAHVCLGTLDETFTLQLRLAKAAGASESLILSCLRFVGEFGWARSLKAIEIVQKKNWLK